MSHFSPRVLSAAPTDGLQHRLELLSAGFLAPIWLMDNLGNIMAPLGQQAATCCPTYGEQRPECIAFRKELYDAAVASGHVCPRQCSHGYSFFAAATPGGGFLHAVAVAGGFRHADHAEQADPAAGEMPHLRISDESILVGALPGLAGLMKDAAVQEHLVPLLNQSVSLLNGPLGQAVPLTCVQEAMEQVLSLAVIGLGVEGVIFEISDNLRMRAIATLGPSVEVLRGAEGPVGMSMSAWVARTGRELLIPDVEADPRGHKVKALQLIPRAWMTVPIHISGTVVGCIQIGWVRPGVPSTLEQSFVRHLAEVLRCIWTRVRSWDRLHRIERTISIAGQFLQDSHSLSHSVALSLDLFRSTWDIKELTKAQADPRSMEGLSLTPVIRSDKNEEVEVLLPVSGSILRIVTGAVPVHSWDERLVRIWLHFMDLSLTVTAVTEERRHAVTTMAGVLADLLARIDREAAAFGDRAAQWVRELIPHLPPEEDIMMLPLAARLIHLDKALDEQQAGAALLPSGASWAPIRDALRCRYEHWDGSGPLGLRGRAIPYGARVLAVVRRFLELGGDQSDQAGIAMVILEKEAGSTYDPSVVHALLLTAYPDLCPPGYVPRSVDVGSSPPGATEAVERPDDEVSPSDALDQRYHLTDREREILRLVAEGASNREIAKALFLSEATVKTHISRVLRKMGVGSRSKAARIYLELSGA